MSRSALAVLERSEMVLALAAMGPGVEKFYRIFMDLDIGEEDGEEAQDRAVVVPMYRKTYAFHAERLEQHRADVQALINEYITDPALYSTGLSFDALGQMENRASIFPFPETAESFIAMAVGLGLAKVSGPNGMPLGFAFLLGHDNIRFLTEQDIQNAQAQAN